MTLVTCPVCLFVTLQRIQPLDERLITVELTVTHRRISAWSSFAIVAFAMISDSMTRNFMRIRFTDAFARSRASFSSAVSSVACAFLSATDPPALRNE